jgi:hypothetical protein
MTGSSCKNSLCINWEDLHMLCHLQGKSLHNTVKLKLKLKGGAFECQTEKNLKCRKFSNVIMELGHKNRSLKKGKQTEKHNRHILLYFFHATLTIMSFKILTQLFTVFHPCIIYLEQRNNTYTTENDLTDKDFHISHKYNAPH